MISVLFFFFNDTATTEIYPLPLHDALPIFGEVIRLLLEAYYEPQFSARSHGFRPRRGCHTALSEIQHNWTKDRKSTRLNSSHANISYAVFCLKKKPLSPLSASANLH